MFGHADFRFVAILLGDKWGVDIGRLSRATWRGFVVEYGFCMFVRLSIASLVSVTAAAAAEPVPVGGADIKDMLMGATVQLDTPLGTKLPVKYASNGIMSGEAGGLAFFLGSNSDRGRWWIVNDKLCHKWFKWFDAEVQCLTLRRDADKLFFIRDDGKTGTATLIAAGPIEEAPFALGHPVKAGEVAAHALAVAEAESEAAPSRAPVALKATVAPMAKPAAPAPAKAHETVAAAKRDAPTQMAAVPKADATAKAASKAPATTKLQASPMRMMQAAVRPTEPVAAQKPVTASSSASPEKVAALSAAQPTAMVQMVSFRVAGVHPADVLNVRQAPSSEAPSVGAIAPRSQGVRLVGKCQLEWCPITHRGVSGWVNSYYLVEEDR